MVSYHITCFPSRGGGEEGGGGGGGGQGVRTPLKNHKNTGFLRNIGPDLLKYHKVTKPEFNVGLSSVLQQNVI